MHPQGSSCFANFGALEAGIALPVVLPNMPLLVIPFCGEIQKTLKAELTVVALFASVDSFVDFEGLVQRERLVAILTDELLQAQVDAFVFLQVSLHGKAPAAGLAWVRLLSGVTPHVHLECGRALELLGAELTGIGPGSEMSVGPSLVSSPRGLVSVAEFTLQLRHLFIFFFLEGLLRRSLPHSTVQFCWVFTLIAWAPVFMLFPPGDFPHFSQLSGFLFGFVVVVRAPWFVRGILVTCIVEHFAHLHTLGLAKPKWAVSIGLRVTLSWQSLLLHLILGSSSSFIEQFRS